MEWTKDPDAVYVDGTPPDKDDIRQSMRDLSRRFSGTGVVSIGEFGAIGDGSDANAVANLAAIQAARAAAIDHGVNSIGVPPGTFKIATGIVVAAAGQESLLEDSLRFIGSGRQASAADYSRIIYTGAAAMFDLRQADGSAVRGGWRFENLALTTSNPVANLMRFNWFDVDGNDYTPTDDATTPGAMQNITFRNCAMDGAAGSGAGADGLLFKKCSVVRIDEECTMIEWRRAVRACVENGEFLYYALNNGRHLQLEGLSTFGNNNKVDLRFTGPTIDAGEAQYFIYDTSKGMCLLSGLFESFADTTACIYFGGSGTRLVAPYFGAASMVAVFELAAGAGDIAIYDPVMTPGGHAAPIIAEASSYEFGYTDAIQRTIRIIGANQVFVNECGRHPRMIWGADPDRANYLSNSPNPQRPRIDSTGGRLNTIETIDPLHFPCVWTNTEASDGVSSRQTNTDAPTGHVFRLNASGNPGFMRNLEVGRDIQNNDRLRICVLAKMEATGGAGTWRWAVWHDGASVANGALTDSATFAQTVINHQVTGAANGDTISIGIVRSGDTHYLDWAQMTWAVVEANIADQVAITGGQSPTEAEFNALLASHNSVLALLGRWNQLAR